MKKTSLFSNDFITNKNQLYCKIIFSAALLLRLVSVGVYYYFDNFTDMTLTDIDYKVVSEGAKYVTQGGSPFQRHTFR